MPEGTEEVSKPTFKDVKGVSKWTDEVFMGKLLQKNGSYISVLCKEGRN
jgi:hypothetical protein